MLESCQLASMLKSQTAPRSTLPEVSLIQKSEKTWSNLQWLPAVQTADNPTVPAPTLESAAYGRYEALRRMVG